MSTYPFVDGGDDSALSAKECYWGEVIFSDEAAAATRTRHGMIFRYKICSENNHADYITYLDAAVFTLDILLA